jgi:hypothetical protein
MALVPKTYNRNIPDAAAYGSTAQVGRHGYNPQIIYYYGTSDETELVRIEKRIQVSNDVINLWAQTISGSGYTKQWPNYDHYMVYQPWEESTTSGTL